MVHNGIIWNDHLVAEEQTKNGVYYVSQQRDGSFNDSEVLLYDLADVIEGKKHSLSVEGSIAFVMVQLDKKGKRKALYFGRNSGNPLKMKKYEHGFSLTSEGDGIDIETNRLFRYDYATRKFSSEYLYIPNQIIYSKFNYNDSHWEKYDDDYSRGYDDNGYELIPSKETGVGYNRYGDRIDRNGHILPSSNSVGVFTERVLDRYKDLPKYSPTEDSNEKEAVREVKNALMYDMNSSAETAIEFGELLIDELQVRYTELDFLITSDAMTTNGEFDEYLELDTKLELLTKAIDQLADTQLSLALLNKDRSLIV